MGDQARADGNFDTNRASTSRGLFGTLYQSLLADWSIVTLFDSAGNKKPAPKSRFPFCTSAA